MRTRLSKTMYLILAAFFVFAGCQQKQQDDVDVYAREPNLHTIRIGSEYEVMAINATGGLDAWTDTVELQLNCVVTFYQPDGSSYLTQQQFSVYPWSNSLEIAGKEPQGGFVWRLSQGHFEILQGDRNITNNKNTLDNQCFAEAILNIVTAPVRLLDQSVDFTIDMNPVKIQGKWFYPIQRRGRADIESILRIPKAVFYQNRDNSIIDVLWIDCLTVEQSIIIRGYDYGEIESGKAVIPHRIEIFIADSQKNPKTRLVKIDIQ
ncbi:MAG: hypothetical protein JW715_00225 [Sedimentisphaerales bacterium]|nr:hypothetical protein [Sedimentisphaerales bacterium]